MELRSKGKPLRRVWLAGCIYAGLLFLAGVAGHILQVGSPIVGSHAGPQVGSQIEFSRELLVEVLIGYGIGAALVLAFSRGLYHRSIASGVLLLVVAIGPIGRAVLKWTLGGVELGPLALMNGVLALSAMVLAAMVIRAIHDLTREGSSQERRLIL
jgi:hypothetical protein